MDLTDQLRAFQIAKDLLNVAVENYGDSCSKWTFIGVDFHDSNSRLLYFPTINAIKILLSESTLEDDLQLYFQLSHEVCHLLYPTYGEEKPTVLNEGISTHFSVNMTNLFFKENNLLRDLTEQQPNYTEALWLVNELLSFDINAISKLRTIEPQINKVVASDFEKANINNVPNSLITQLLRTFE